MTMAMPQLAGISSNWGTLAFRGVLAILLGLLAFAMPGLAMAALVTLFGFYALMDGMLTITAALRGVREHDRWGWMFIEGIAGAVVGLVALFTPVIGAIALVWLIAAWAIATGALEIAAAVHLRKLIEREWMLLVAGVLSIALGLVIALQPGIGIAVIVTWIGAYALVVGAVNIALALRIRRWTHDHG